MHKLLENQIKRFFGDKEVPKDLLRLFTVVSDAYKEHDTERKFLEQALAQVSDELNSRNSQLEKQVNKLQFTHEDLSRSVAMVDSIFEATGEAIFSYDQQGNLVRYNKAALRVLNLSSEGVSISDIQISVENILSRSKSYESEIKQLKHDKTAKIHGSLIMEDGRCFDYYSSHQQSEAGILGRVWCFRDTTANRKNEDMIKFHALHDSLTHLPNRSLLQDRLEQGIALSDATDRTLALLFVDLDHFKKVNDTVGHHVGDQLLVFVTRRLENCISRRDTLARFGGDEFVVLLENFTSEENIKGICRRIIEQLTLPFEIDNHSFYISCSIGVSVYRNDKTDPETLMRQADLAMYQAKKNGRATYEFFDPLLEESATNQVTIENRLRKAIENDELTVYFQPKIELKTGFVQGFEALIRWFPKNESPIRPDVFIPIAERTGLIGELDCWVLEQSCRHLRQWQRNGHPNLSISINLSTQHFRDPELVDNIERIISKEGVDTRYVELEVTETLLMEDFERAVIALTYLRHKGVRVAIDDFGTGYSSLQYLKELPIDTIKIDRCFIRDIEDNPNDQSIVSAIITLGHNLNLTVVAEGAEKLESVNYLKECRCDLVQGYYFFKPVSAEAASEILKSQSKPLLGWVKR